jgi:shikimate kinase
VDPAGTGGDANALMPHRLTLVGYRACGKSTVGRLVAARLAWPFIDADTVVEGRLGMPIRQFFAEHGEAAFRDAETEALAGILAGNRPLVLATGGGAVLRDANRALLSAQGGLVVYLHAAADVLQTRLRHHAGGRPSLTGGNVADEVPQLLAQRDPLYRSTAAAVVEVDRPLVLVADDLAALVQSAQPPAPSP